MFGSLEAVFFATNSLKISHGGWFRLVCGPFIFVVMITWNDGLTLLRKQLPT